MCIQVELTSSNAVVCFNNVVKNRTYYSDVTLKASSAIVGPDRNIPLLPTNHAGAVAKFGVLGETDVADAMVATRSECDVRLALLANPAQLRLTQVVNFQPQCSDLSVALQQLLQEEFTPQSDTTRTRT